MSYKNYDFNLWGDSETSITLVAYPHKRRVAPDGNAYIETEYSELQSHKLRLVFPEEIKAIEAMLEDLYINNYPLTDYDDWLDIREISPEYPEEVNQFLRYLPENKLEEDN
jgi:hypothetical protein